MHNKAHNLDPITSVTDREELAAAFGEVAAWATVVHKLREREHREKDARRKRNLRLQLYNAEVQLALHKTKLGD